ncbi:fibronectin type III domain-containing protein [Amycolatopsis sp. lyj-23]|uniref:fibronectin type III domain-containing protein n=1 Tax=Amycolatopsis sp. lyj-23 TaxID=2789283 RepID=UPI00397A4456
MPGQRRTRAAVAVWAGVFLAATTFVVIAAGSDARPDLNFQQEGHWVYNPAEQAAFHVNGGTKQVDARTGKVELTGAVALGQGDRQLSAVGGGKAIVFGKSDLAVAATFAASGGGDVPVSLEVPGGPYYVYKQAGTVVRFAQLPPVTLRAGGTVGEPAPLADGTIWFQRVDNGALCRVKRDAGDVLCPVNTAGRQGDVVATGDQAVFVDPAAGTVTPFGESGAGTAANLGVRDLGDARTATVAVARKLPLVDPRGNRLILAALDGLGGEHPASPPITVGLGAGDFAAPVTSTDAVAVLDRAGKRVLTFTPEGRQKATTSLPEGAGQARMTRGQDGRVYVDAQDGAHTVVVDHDGSVTTVGIGKADVPSPDTPKTPQPPVTPSVVPPGKTPPPSGKGAKDPAKVPPKAPGAPGAVDAQPGNATVKLSWNEADANGAAVTEYRVGWRSTAGGGTDGALGVGGNQLRTEVPGLRNGATYVFTVTAVNSVGPGPGADSQPVTPSSEVPGAPGVPAATAADDGTVKLTWAPADGQGHQIRNYTVTAHGADGSATAAGTSADASLTTAAGALTLGTAYTFTVTAANELGLSSADSPSSGVVSPYSPAAAVGSLNAAADDSTVSLTWTAPELNGGDLAGYRVEADGLSPQTVTAPKATFTGLSNGTKYTFTVRATTRQRGTTGATVDGAPATASATPGRAPKVDVTGAASSGDRQITLTVGVADYSSGAVTCHVVLNGAERWTGGCASGNSITVGGLSYATTYDIYVTGENGFGRGPTGSHGSARTNDPPPPPPSVSVAKGGRYSGSACTDPSCAYVTVSARNFAANTSYSVSCVSTVDGTYYTYSARTNGSGAFDSSVCFFGYRGKQVWAVVGSVESNHLTW